MDQEQTPTSIFAVLVDLAQSFIIALVIFVVVYNFVAQPHRVRGDSMLPNFQSEEYLLTEKISYQLGDPQRGDVVVLQYPENPNVDFIKRIVGLPGETLLIEDNHVYINDELLQETYLPASTNTSGNGVIKQGVPYSIPQGEYVVMGDNRTRSSDSRTWGTVPRDLIVGKAFFVYWPIDNFGIVANANAN